MKALLLSILLASSCYSYADNETKDVKLNELVNVTNTNSVAEQVYSQMDVMMRAVSRALRVQPSEQAIFDEHYSRLTLMMEEDLSWTKIEPLIVDIYNRNFTEKEIDELLAFYKTDTGKSLLLKMPTIMQESMQISDALVQDFIPIIQDIGVKLNKDLAKSRNSE